MEAESAQAHSKSGYAARPASYKSSLSSQVAKGKHKGRSPEKEVVVIKQDGGRRRDEEDERDNGSSKPKPSAEVIFVDEILY